MCMHVSTHRPVGTYSPCACTHTHFSIHIPFAHAHTLPLCTHTCMHICTCVPHVHKYVYTRILAHSLCAHTCILTYAHTPSARTHVYTGVFTSPICVHIHTCAHMLAHPSVCTCTRYLCTDKCMPICTRAPSVCTYSNTHLCMHTHALKRPSSSVTLDAWRRRCTSVIPSPHHLASPDTPPERPERQSAAHYASGTVAHSALNPSCQKILPKTSSVTV